MSHDGRVTAKRPGADLSGNVDALASLLQGLDVYFPELQYLIPICSFLPFLACY
jgi:hypothetical protein